MKPGARTNAPASWRDDVAAPVGRPDHATAPMASDEPADDTDAGSDDLEWRVVICQAPLKTVVLRRVVAQLDCAAAGDGGCGDVREKHETAPPAAVPSSQSRTCGYRDGPIVAMKSPHRSNRAPSRYVSGSEFADSTSPPQDDRDTASVGESAEECRDRTDGALIANTAGGLPALRGHPTAARAGRQPLRA